MGGNVSSYAAEEVEERFTRRTRGEAKKRFANLKVAFEEEEKVEKDKRIGRIVKKMEDAEKKQSRRQKKIFAKESKETRISNKAPAAPAGEAAGPATEESKVKETGFKMICYFLFM